MGLLPNFRRAQGAGLPFPVPVYLRPMAFMRPSYKGLLRMRFQTALYNDAIAAKADFKRAKKEGVSTEELAVLSEKSATLALATLKHSTSNFVTPDSDEAVIEQVQNNELVHPVKNRDELLGRFTDGRDCLSRTIDTEEGSKVLCHIFRANMRVPEINGRISVADFFGDIVAVKSGNFDNKDPNLTAYFAISSTWFGSGPQLILDLKGETPAGRAEVTMSPMRGFTATNDADVMDAWSDQEFNNNFIDYLQNGVEDKKLRDAVYGFHGHSNGAIVANIHRNVGNGEPIVNYLYIRPMAGDNKQRLQDGLLPVTPLIYKNMSNAQVARGAYNICSSPFTPK